MVFECCVVNYRSDHAGEEKTTVLYFLKEEHLQIVWLKFVNRKN